MLLIEIFVLLKFLIVMHIIIKHYAQIAKQVTSLIIKNAITVIALMAIAW
jgi:hypothetical protein